MKRRNLFGFSVAALSLVAGEALAQFSRRGKGQEKGGGREPANTLEVTLQEFHEDLKLTAQQETLWQVYADRVRALASDVARERRQSPALALPQRIDRAVDVARDRLTAVEDIALAAKALYAQLAPQQQEAADPRLANLITLPFTAAPAAAGDRKGR